MACPSQISTPLAPTRSPDLYQIDWLQQSKFNLLFISYRLHNMQERIEVFARIGIDKIAFAR